MSQPSSSPTLSPFLAIFSQENLSLQERLEKCIEEAGACGWQGLQDASLLVCEALESDAERPFLLETYLSLIEHYPEKKNVASDIIDFLRQPVWQIPLVDEEWEQLKTTLLEESHYSETSHVLATPVSLEDILERFSLLIEKAGEAGLQGLQDACLLLVDAFGGDPDNTPTLETGLALAEAYYQTPSVSYENLIRFLSGFQEELSLNDEEWNLLRSLLQDVPTEEEITLQNDVLVENLVLTERTEIPIEPLSSILDSEVVTPSTDILSEEEIKPLLSHEERESRLKKLPKSVRELVDILLMQTDALILQLDEAPTHPAEALSCIKEGLELFTTASRTAGFQGLAEMCEAVGVNLTYWIEHPLSTSHAFALLRNWLHSIATYLPSMLDPGTARNMVEYGQHPHWPCPLSVEQSEAIQAHIQVIDSQVWLEEGTSRPHTATAEDVSLALPDDVNRELLDILLQELPVQTQQFSETIQSLRKGSSQADIDKAQRIAHTLKGAANTVGIKGIAVLTHHLEDILLACAKEHRSPTPALLQVLINAVDCLEGMTEALLEQTPPPEGTQEVLQEVLDWANKIDRFGLPEQDEPQAIPLEKQPTTLSDGKAIPERDSPTTTPHAAPTAQTPSVRITVDQIESLFRLSGESIILNGQAQERQRRLKDQFQSMEAQFTLLGHLGAELEELVDIKDLTGRIKGTHSDFDMLEMDQYNELHTASRRMAESAVDAREIGLDMRKELDYLEEVLEYQQRLVIDIQEALMRTRLVPVSSIVPRLQRSIRQTCRVTAKEAELRISGGHLLIDGDVLNALADPLMHILRNAIDHGLESPEERHILGKPLQGDISIDFDREGNHVIVRCRDDGKGLDLEAIRETAIRRGVVQAGQELSEEELQRLILRPNFSTRTQSTQTSGRGIGMDAVHSQALALGGTLGLHSVAGQGMTVELRVPLPLSRSHALLAYAGRHRVAITSKGIIQVLYSGAGELQYLAGHSVLLLDGELYPAVRLDELLRVTDRRTSTRHGGILMVQAEEGITAVLLDTITDSRDVVIKGLGYYIQKIPGIVGATILGDGSVTPVIDVPELLRRPAHMREGMADTQTDSSSSVVQGPPMVVVVDDSLSNRRALEQLVKDAGYRVRVARDGIEAAELISHVRPSIVLTDLEMPRMNGLELAAHLRKQPNSKTLPLIMITSRTTQRHRELAAQAGIDFYLSKPVRDEDLLDKIHILLHRSTVDTSGTTTATQ